MSGAPAQGTGVGEGSALREMLVVAFPAVVTMTSYTAMQFVDTLVVSRLGPEAVAATGNGGIAAFVPASIMFGMVSVVNTYVSQHLGAGRPERGAAYAWNALWFNALVWAAVLLPYAAALPWIFAEMRGMLRLAVDPRVAAMESQFGRILMAGMVFTIGARALSHYFYGLHRPRVVMVSALVANVVNLGLSIVLVYGLWGFPRLGVPGSAVGTCIGGIVEFSIPMTLFLSKRYDERYGTRKAWRFDFGKIKELFRIGWPAGAMWGNEILCWWVFMSGFNATFGVAHNTAGWIVLRYMHLSFMPAVGLSIAMTAVVGRCIGAGRQDLVRARTWLGVRVAMAYMGACALVMLVFRGALISFFVHAGGATEGLDAAGAAALHDQIITIGSHLLIVAAAFQLFDAMAITLSGALRGAGDTIWPGVVTIVLNWVFIIGMGWGLVVWAPQLKSLGPWLGAAAYIIALALVYLWRFESGAWKWIKLVDHGGMPPVVADAGDGLVADLPGIDVPGGGAGTLGEPGRG